MKNQKPMLRLTELIKDNDSVKEKPVLVNPEGIVSVHESTIKREGVPIITGDGSSLDGRTASNIQLTTGRYVTVAETIEDINALLIEA